MVKAGERPQTEHLLISLTSQQLFSEPLVVLARSASLKTPLLPWKLTSSLAAVSSLQSFPPDR